MSSDSTSLASRPGVVRFAWFATFYNILVVVWGALVRASGSGAGCGNHWPLCNGQVIPVSPGIHTIIEFTHRMMTGGSTFIVLGLLIWVFRAVPKAHAARWFAVASTVLLLNEAFLGALLVKLDYVTGNRSAGRMVLLAIHLSNTLLLLAALAFTARFAATDLEWRGLQRARHFAWAVAGLLATVCVGVSGSMAALADTLFPSTSLQVAFTQDLAAGSPLLLRLRLLHPASALLAAAFVVWLLRATHISGRRSDQRLARAVVLLLAVQFVLGIADVVLLAPAWIQLLHLLGADLYWCALVVFAAETVWPTDVFVPEPVSHAPAVAPVT